MKIRDRIRNSRKLNWFYSQYEDFNHGRNLFGKFTSMANEFNLAILIATFLFGINLKDHIPEAIKWTLVALVVVFFVGKLYRHMNLLEVEQRACTNRNPVSKIQLEASEIIIDRFGRHKDDINIYGDKR